MKIGIVGGGASGMTAAIAAARQGAQVTILERNDRIGKKILATGNGKCNLSNLDFQTEYYRSEDPERVGTIIKADAVRQAQLFFEQIGLMIKSKNGYLYPECEQASAVLDVLRHELTHLNVRVVCDEEVVTAKKRTGGGFALETKSGRKYIFDRVILSCGTSAGLKKGTKTDLPKSVASIYGLDYVKQVPALVQLRCEEDFCKALAGVRCQAGVTLRVGNDTYREDGELQLTDYGISGIPVFQLSRFASYGLLREQKLPVEIDFLPSLKEKEWEEFLRARRQTLDYKSMEDFLIGTVHKKIAGVLLKQCGIRPAETAGCVNDSQYAKLSRLMKHFPMTVTGTNPIENSQVLAGGIKLTEVSENMELIKCEGLYLTGELLDADGRCGGYNLQWAWSTGITAGIAAGNRRALF